MPWKQMVNFDFRKASMFSETTRKKICIGHFEATR